MPYQLFWVIKDRVFYENQTGKVTASEIHDLTIQIADYLDDAYQRNHGIVIGILDMREANLSNLVQSHTPAGIRQITDAIDPRIWKVKKGFTVLITNRTHVKMVISLITMLVSQPITTVGNFDEALDVAATMYPDLRVELEMWKGADPLASATANRSDHDDRIG